MNPRKAIISVAIALAVLAAAGPLQAQVPFVPRAEFGVKAGINLSDINTDQLGSSTRMRSDSLLPMMPNPGGKPVTLSPWLIQTSSSPWP